uniref:hypothetical protein n=1 Tax=Herbidospora sakaeratensis TaxID=564415 RepID=UPI0007841286|nr:hypothetical protein [Herbidospora sakaeratensis]
MSIWNTFKTFREHGVDNHLTLSHGYEGNPLRIGVDEGPAEAYIELTREQVRELAADLNAWADDDEQRVDARSMRKSDGLIAGGREGWRL